MCFRMRRVICIIIVLVVSAAAAGCERAAPVESATEPIDIRLEVSGMTCENCENAITQTLTAMPGVVSVQASHEAGTVDVRTRDPSQREAIINAIENMNYQVAKAAKDS